MTFLLEHPEATLDYTVDWGSDYLSGEALATSDWAVEPDEPGGAAVASSLFGLLTSTVTIGGGVVGHIYRLTNHVTTTNGCDDSRSIILRVEKR